MRHGVLVVVALARLSGHGAWSIFDSLSLATNARASDMETVMRSAFAAIVVVLVANANAFAAEPGSLWGRLSVTGNRGTVAGGSVRLVCADQQYTVELAVDARGRF